MQERYHLYRIETSIGDETFIIAEDEAKAAEIYACWLTLEDEQHQLYRIFQWEERLTIEQRKKIAPYLFLGPPSVMTWCPTCGWSVEPPG